ncbi:MAG: hypothetical protein J6Y75_09505 [Spirochaetaceae bacterium]|nr:hypothetical protein [Spirochaetaceae bacterium]
MKRTCFFILFFFIFLILPLTADQGNNSDSIYSYLQEEGLAPYIILNRTQSKEFPYNICLDFPSISPLDPSVLVISIPQDDVPFFIDSIVQFAKELKNFARETEVMIVFTAGDTAYLPPYISLPAPTGTKTILENIDTSQKIAAILLQKAPASQKTEVSLIAGINRKTTPPWMLSDFFNAARKTGIKSEIYGGNVTAYRLGLIRSNMPLYQFFSAQIPAILLQSTTADVCKVLPAFLDNLEHTGFRVWDNHYGLFMLKDKMFFVSEPIFLTLLILIAFIILLFFCLFSFFREKTRVLHLPDLKKIWFLIPLLLLLTWILLFAGQIITKKLYPQWFTYPLNGTLFKISVAIMLMAAASILHKWIHFSTNDYIYAWLSNIISFVNLFLFASLELSLITFFSIQFLIYFFASYLRKTRYLLLSALLLTLTYIPFIISIHNLPHDLIYFRFINASVYENLIIAFFLVPIEFMWIRILVRLRLIGNNARFSFPFIIVTVLLFAITGILCTRFIKPTESETNLISVTECTDKISCTTNRKSFLDRSRIELNISTELQPIKAEVSVASDADITIYDSNFPFANNDKENKTDFLLDEFPPNPLQIVYTCEKNYESRVFITAYMKDSDGNILKEIRQLQIAP